MLQIFMNELFIEYRKSAISAAWKKFQQAANKPAFTKKRKLDQTAKAWSSTSVVSTGLYKSWMTNNHIFSNNHNKAELSALGHTSFSDFFVFQECVSYICSRPQLLDDGLYPVNHLLPHSCFLWPGRHEVVEVYHFFVKSGKRKNPSWKIS